MLIALFITTFISVLFNIFLLINMQIAEKKKNQIISDVVVLQTEMQALHAANTIMHHQFDEYKNELNIQMHTFSRNMVEEKCESPTD